MPLTPKASRLAISLAGVFSSITAQPYVLSGPRVWMNDFKDEQSLPYDKPCVRTDLVIPRDCLKASYSLIVA